ncbi:hypothetical protein N0V93_004714 [Gnomoniopsis smithogilvyi]|uniref:Ankyrin n=1 Tax=Gnomoniopsis smithogilvyi TaxID=1191159 RepID=A0A9W9CXD6_9PEZI|nr:hypothetical protein N0V93_004714 [Gnomoniopsis smithogilvyi]
MASPLESLPFELLEAISYYTRHTKAKGIDPDFLPSRRSERSPYSHLARLVRTSKSLQYQIEPLLYSSDTSRTIALYRAIRKGNVDTIRKTISYGASPHAVRYGSRYHWCVPALYLAIKSQNLAAFQALVDHGADVRRFALWALSEPDHAGLGEIVGSPTSGGERLRKKLVRRLCQPSNEEFLRLLINEAAAELKDGGGLGSEAFPPIRHIPLVSIIQWAGPDLVQLLLDRQADPNKIHSGLGHQFLTPLSAAVLARSPTIFKLLVSRGADINGKDIPKSREAGMHIPVIAAGARMLDDMTAAAMMELCLEHGANINRPCHEHPLPNTVNITTSRRGRDDVIPHVCTTALIEFLKSPKDWFLTLRKMGPVVGLNLRYLLDAGASAISPPSQPIIRRNHNKLRYLHDRTYAGASSTVEILIDRYGLGPLHWAPSLLPALERLIKRGAARPFFARILVKYDSVGKPSDWTDPDAICNWQRLLDLLIADLKKSEVNIDAVLRRVIADKGSLRKLGYGSPWRGVGEIGRATINALIAAGANINARMDVPFRETTSSYRDTALQEVCAALIHTDGLHDEFHDHDDGHMCEFSLMNEANYSSWFAFLISKGADPYLGDTHPYREGESAIDIMLSPMKEGRGRMDGRGSLEKHLMRLVAVLKGTTEPLIYDGVREPYELEDFDWLFPSRHMGRIASGQQCLAR